MRPPAVHHLARVDNELFASRGHHSLPEVYVQGRAFFPDPTLAYVDGASFGGGCLRVGWVPAFRDCSRLTETGRAHVELRCIIQWIKRETIRQVLPGCKVTHDERHAHAGGWMIEVHDLFEVHLTVTNLDAAIGFYRDVLGLPLAHVTTARQAAFFWIGSAGRAMLGLWAAGSAPQTVLLHTAFRVGLADVMAAPNALRSAGITPLDFDGKPTDLPVVLAWMPAAAVYFRDPDGHLLEYIAMLPHKPRPDCGVVPWRMWDAMNYETPIARFAATPL